MSDVFSLLGVNLAKNVLSAMSTKQCLTRLEIMFARHHFSNHVTLGPQQMARIAQALCVLGTARAKYQCLSEKICTLWIISSDFCE